MMRMSIRVETSSFRSVRLASKEDEIPEDEKHEQITFDSPRTQRRVWRFFVLSHNTQEQPILLSRTWAKDSWIVDCREAALSDLSDHYERYWRFAALEHSNQRYGSGSLNEADPPRGFARNQQTPFCRPLTIESDWNVEKLCKRVRIWKTNSTNKAEKVEIYEPLSTMLRNCSLHSHTGLLM